MAKRNITKVAGAMLCMGLAATCVLGGTLAKYASTGTSGALTAQAGQWSITLDGTELSDSINIDMTGMTITANGAQANSAAYADEAPVPGTYGYKEITLHNGGVVDAMVKMTAASATNDSSALTVGLMTEAPSGSAITSDENLTGADGVLVKAGTDQKLYVAYDWAFDGDDTNDTELGKTPGDINFGTVTLNAEQAKLEQ